MYTGKYRVPTFEMVNTHRVSEVSSKFHGIGKLWASYEFRKGQNWTNKTNMTNNSPTKEQYIKKDHIIPGQMVSANNLISWSSDGLYHIRVDSTPSEIFSGGCLFVDHTNDFMSINH